MWYTQYGYGLWVACAFASQITSALAQSGTLKLEAESAALSGTTVDTAQAGFSGMCEAGQEPSGCIAKIKTPTGSGYVTGFDTAADKVTFRVAIDLPTLYDVEIRYAGIYGEKKTSLALNGGSTSEIDMPATTTWATVSAGQVLLNAGDNTLDIVSNWGW